jgi:sugar phosphate isomerase/epimerase
MKIDKIGNAVIRLIKSADLFETGLALGKLDPAFCLCDNPNCTDCVNQRAALFRDRIAGEDFILAASSELAGRYVPEMIENLQRAGIDHIELDIIQGKPLNMLKADFLKKAVAELNENNIKVSGLRYACTPDDIDTVFTAAEECSVKRIILPLSCRAEDIASQAKAKELETVFFNVNHTGAETAAIVKKLPAPGLVFSPAGFAACGEMPFLRSFQANKFRKFINQLDIEDGLWDGTPTPLAEGNAEIKELMSILRCASFKGYMVLRNAAENFDAAVADFTDALDTI